MNRLQLIYGKDEIKNLQPKVKKILQKIDEHESPLYTLGNDTKFMDDVGNTYNLKYSRSTGVAFLDKKQVIKIGYLCRTPPPAKYRVPTLIYSDEELDREDWGGAFVVLIQPRVKLIDPDDLTKTNKVFKNIKKGSDIHEDNVGIYRNQFKLIDW